MSAVSVHRRSRPAILPHDSVANHANGSYARDLNIYQPRGWAELGSLRVRDSGRGTYPECGRRTFHRWAFARAARSRRYRSMRTHCSRATWSWRSRARISSWSRSTFSSSSRADMFSRQSCGERNALASTATKVARTTEPQLVFTALAPLLALGPEPPAVPFLSNAPVVIWRPHVGRGLVISAHYSAGTWLRPAPSWKRSWTERLS